MALLTDSDTVISDGDTISAGSTVPAVVMGPSLPNSTLNNQDSDQDSPLHNLNDDSLSPPSALAAGAATTITATTTTTAPNSINGMPFSDTDDDNHSGLIDLPLGSRDYTGMFEGPEKTLEVVFRKINNDERHNVVTMGEVSDVMAVTLPNQPIVKTGLRCLTRTDLDRICARACCTILSGISNQYLDAYVLSESSLFVYPYMLILKTCGTTTLLRCIATLIDLARKQLGLEIDWVEYSRKNFNFPGDQAFPHQSFHQELDYLYSHRSLCERLDGAGYTLGPVTGDHWFVFVADHTVRARGLEIDTDRVLNIMMFDIDEERVAKFFHFDQYEASAVEGETKDEKLKRISKQQTVASGIDNLCPGAIIDACAFEPCGYSMNAILFRSYTTIHVTPESGSSYASFETNQKVASYKALISNVIRTFRPKRFVMTLMADEGGLGQVKENPLTDSTAESRIVVQNSSSKAGASSNSVVYKRSSLASIKVEEDCCCFMGNWVLENPSGTGNHNLSNGNEQQDARPRGMSFS